MEKGPMARKLGRKVKKQKKLLALMEISELNQRDRQKAASSQHDPESEEPEQSQEEPKRKKCKKNYEEGKIKVETMSTEEFMIRKVKVENGDVEPQIKEEKIEPNDITKTFKRELLSEEDIIELRKRLRERRILLSKLPKLVLKEPGCRADVVQEPSCRIPLFLTDIQHFMLFSQLGHMSTGNIPRWAGIEKFRSLSQTVFLIVDGLCLNDFIDCRSELPTLSDFKIKVEVITPVTYGGNFVEELVAVPLTETQRHKLEKRYGSLKYAVHNSGRVYKVLRTIFPIEKAVNPPNTPREPNSDRFSRRELLLSAWQMVEENFPMPLRGELMAKYKDYVQTKDSYMEVTSDSPMWALDCEMCLTKSGNELTRISIVNEKFEVMYESLVKPYNKIIDYLTQFSGITESMLRNVWTRLEDVQQDIRRIFPSDLILIGHSLNSDMHALKMMHPYVIDTSVIYNLSGERFRKSKLKVLAAEFLSERIQMGSSSGHDSVEDSVAAMKLVQCKLQHSIEWGDSVLSGPRPNGEAQASLDLLLARDKHGNMDDSTDRPATLLLTPPGEVKPKTEIATSLFTHLANYDNHVAVIGKVELVAEYQKYMPEHLRVGTDESRVKCVTMNSNRGVIKKIIKVAPTVSFTLAHVTVGKDPGTAMAKVEKWASDIIENSAGNALLAILLAGSEQNKNHGLCLISLKDTVIPKMNYSG